MITQESALETLSRYRIGDTELEEWEDALGLNIPLDEFDNKLYTTAHINLFKNIKKHLILGRTMDEIRRMIVLPSDKPAVSNAINSDATTIERPGMAKPFGDTIRKASAAATAGPQVESIPSVTIAPPLPTTIRQPVSLQEPAPIVSDRVENDLAQRLLRELAPTAPKTTPESRTVPINQPTRKAIEAGLQQGGITKPRVSYPLKRFASSPTRVTTSAMLDQGPSAGLILLVDRLMAEKDDQQNTIVLLEKQKTHLHQASAMLQDKIKELKGEVEVLNEQLRARESFKLIDDKSRLQKQLLDSEQTRVAAQKRLEQTIEELRVVKDRTLNKANPNTFIGNWLEEAELVEIVFDNFGINIESKRNRMFRITNAPARYFGQAAIIETTFDYQTNALWKRTETLILSILTDNRLEGEMLVEYTLDGTPVAKANYRVKCHRNGVRTD